MKWLKIIILTLSLVPIEFIGLFTDYQTGLLIVYNSCYINKYIYF